ncbi:MAG: heavy metal translocating P-type ATPase, partial [Gemmatimonadota bacterium]
SINQAGTLVVEVTAIGAEGFLQQVAHHVEEARALKPSVLQLVDWILKYYVPTVLLIGLAAFLFWSIGWWAIDGAADWTRAIFAMLTVYVMGYPCALGMATPLALVRGGGLAAERGVLMRSADSFQVFKDVDVVVLDKTGTITEGRPYVVRVAAVNGPKGEGNEQSGGGEAEREVLRLAAIAEQASEHPLADAIVTRARTEGLELSAVDDFEAVIGRGVITSLDGRELLVGSPGLLEERGVEIDRAREGWERMRARGQTAVLVAAGGKFIGAIGIADRIKEGSKAAIRQLQAMGVEVVMLTGDDEQAARAVAQEVGIDRVLAGVLPANKAEEVGRLQEEGHRVAMVGDGINDAPALTRADVGVAIGAGTDIALESADVVLIHSRLSGVVAAFDVSRNSYRKTKQNLALAFTFNGIGVPIAFTGLLQPVWAMAAMVASVSLVLANSFGGRLIRGEQEKEAEEEPAPAGEKPRKLILSVPGMHCDGCATSIVSALREHPAVESVEADPHTGTVRLGLRRAVSDSDLAERVAAAGFEVE